MSQTTTASSCVHSLGIMNRLSCAARYIFASSQNASYVHARCKLCGTPLRPTYDSNATVFQIVGMLVGAAVATVLAFPAGIWFNEPPSFFVFMLCLASMLTLPFCVMLLLLIALCVIGPWEIAEVNNGDGLANSRILDGLIRCSFTGMPIAIALIRMGVYLRILFLLLMLWELFRLIRNRKLLHLFAAVIFALIVFVDYVFTHTPAITMLYMATCFSYLSVCLAARNQR